MIGPVIFLSFAVFLLVGTPIAICLGVSSVFGMLIDGAGRPLEYIYVPELAFSWWGMPLAVVLIIPSTLYLVRVMDRFRPID